MSAIALAAMLPNSTCAETLVYKLKMKLEVPRIYDNMQSKGYRKVQAQYVYGYVYVDTNPRKGSKEPSVSVCCVYNKTHKVSGKSVTYSDAEATEVTWRFIGSNKTGVFKQPCLKFSLDLNPSYNIGADEPDNTLVITLSGRGKNYKSISGKVTGQIGCGCSAYGHVSPTRTIVYGVDDISPLSGTFTMKLVK